MKVDLHGYDVITAVEFALTRAAEAYRNGYDGVELVHGAADVETPVDDGRGRIKWELRRLVAAGRFHAYADQAWQRQGSIVLTLKRNPRPRVETWSEPPLRAHPR